LGPRRRRRHPRARIATLWTSSTVGGAIASSTFNFSSRNRLASNEDGGSIVNSANSSSM
jgi:hypothetical protein